MPGPQVARARRTPLPPSRSRMQGWPAAAERLTTPARASRLRSRSPPEPGQPALLARMSSPVPELPPEPGRREQPQSTSSLVPARLPAQERPTTAAGLSRPALEWRAGLGTPTPLVPRWRPALAQRLGREPLAGQPPALLSAPEQRLAAERPTTPLL